MAKEIERKFTVINDDWRASVNKSSRYRQGYLGKLEKASVRIRVQDDSANINIKSATLGISRQEYEYSIPLSDAQEMLNALCNNPQIDKIRHFVEYGGKTWEIDEFFGDNEGLVVAEIELDSEDEVFDVPPWAGEDVSHDKRYYNVCLVEHPYKDWQDNV